MPTAAVDLVLSRLSSTENFIETDDALPLTIISEKTDVYRVVFLSIQREDWRQTCRLYLEFSDSGLFPVIVALK